MQSFGDLFANNRLLAIGVVLAAIAVILAVGIALFRLVFGRRLHMSGGRTRQPRLGVVDAFDLDRQRQLVLIRRDNVEHLLMIGGPNDVLVEAAIVRAPAALAGRDKDNGFSPSVGIPAPIPQQPSLPPAPLPTSAAAPAGGPEGGTNLPFPAPMPPEPTLASVAEPVRPVAAVEPVPPPSAAPTPVATPDTRLPAATNLPPVAQRPLATAPRSTSPLPPRAPVSPIPRPAAAPTPRTNLSRATPVAPPAANGASSEQRQPARVEPTAARPAPDGPSTNARPAPQPGRDAPTPMRFPPPRVTRTEEPTSASTTTEPDRPSVPQPGERAGSEEVPQNQALRPATPPRPVQTPPSRSVPPRPQSPPPPPAPPRPAMPSLGSLEEEMAKLLGRPMPPSDTPGSGT